MEERNFSWTDLFIKVILIIIFTLFTIWLLSLSNKGLSNSLSVLTDEIYMKNIERMKEAGREYFTTERLPEKKGDIKILTLEKMYDKKLLLELKDKNGNSCSAKNSYVSVEKYENEYQMKIYLECGEQKDYIIVIMGCYDYCDTDICEKKDTTENITNTDPTPTPTPIPKPTPNDNKYTEYEYKKTTGGYWTEYGSFSEWSKTAVANTDYRQVESKTVSEPYSYDTKVTDTRYSNFNISCPSTYTLSNGKCVKTISSTATTSPNKCPSNYNGYTLVSQNGLTCNYRLTTTSTSAPICASKYGNGTYTSISNFTCYYKESVQSCQQVAYKELVIDYCGSTPCGQYWETKYKNVCSTNYKTTSTSATCKSGYTNINGICTLKKTSSTTTSATCPSGYSPANNTCIKTTNSLSETAVIKTCPSGYNATSDNSRCYQNYEKTVTVNSTKNVIYYRYRTREYVNGSEDSKWSRSNNDNSLLNAGYKLTGQTRTISGK